MKPAPFDRLLVVGAGLLGTSVALAVKRCWPGVHVTAMDVAARAHGPFDAHLGAGDPLPAFDLAVLACPLDGYDSWMARLAAEAPDRSVTDVGSAKRLPHRLARAHGLASFAGGHPMAGGSRPGPDRASVTLFDGRVWFLTTDGATAESAGLARALAEGCGGRVVAIAPDAHDEAVAAISHLPQVVASILMATVADAVADAALAAAAGGLRDSTRIAEGPVTMWQPIFAANADLLAPLVRETAARLHDLAGRLSDPEAVRALFTAANAGRRRLPPL
ncbi:MAG TPA: prephenate dehydrogenase/arogenate dehydrogenase family protein [Vicinamibacterales bacterium]|nr:prephenate dehydrogenase/arogenate dehydrogenase family protein [Vicinamibacterales bacterium]